MAEINITPDDLEKILSLSRYALVVFMDILKDEVDTATCNMAIRATDFEWDQHVWLGMIGGAQLNRDQFETVTRLAKEEIRTWLHGAPVRI